MNLGQIHECLRLELLRRIKRGTLSVSLLARQSGFGTSHISSFLRAQRRLSAEGMDRILAAQRLSIVDLLDAEMNRSARRTAERMREVPIVSHHTAMYEPVIRAHAVLHRLHLPAELFGVPNEGASPSRRNWEQFVAVRISAAEAVPMEPLVLPEAVVVLDRHAVTFTAQRKSRSNLFGVRDEARLKLRHAEYQMQCLVLRPHNPGYPVELLDVESGGRMGEVLAGRVVLILNVM